MFWQLRDKSRTLLRVKRRNFCLRYVHHRYRRCVLKPLPSDTSPKDSAKHSHDSVGGRLSLRSLNEISCGSYDFGVDGCNCNRIETLEKCEGKFICFPRGFSPGRVLLVALNRFFPRVDRLA